MKDIRLSVILPAYNEGAVIADSIRETSRALADVDYEIIVVDDGSTDDTLSQARQAAREDPCVEIIHYERNHGKGYALKQGFAHAGGDRIAFLDADGDLHPRQLLVLSEVMESRHADVVIGSKLLSKPNYPLLRRVVSWGYFSLAHFLFGLPVHDTQTGIKLFRREVLEQVFPHVQIERFAFDLELILGAHLYGYSIAEAPVELDLRRTETPLGDVVRSGLNMAWDTLRVFYWASFWKWLSPSLSTRLWIAVALGGLVVASISVGHLLNNFAVPPPLSFIVDLLLLRFLDRTLRDLLLLFGGIALIGIAAVQLNKQVVAAFARKDRTDFWGHIERGKRRE